MGIADWIGGTVDTTTSFDHGPSGVSFQGVGEVTCSLGEIANRGDLIIFWGSNPADTHPRHFSKYSLLPAGMFVPGGRQDRTCVLIDVHQTKSAESADIFLQIKPGKDFEALWILCLSSGTVTRPASGRRRDRRDTVRLAGSHRADEAGQFRRDSVRHGTDNDPRQAPQ